MKVYHKNLDVPDVMITVCAAKFYMEKPIMNCKHCGNELQTFQWKGMYSSPKYWWCPECDLWYYTGGTTAELDDKVAELSQAAQTWLTNAIRLLSESVPMIISLTEDNHDHLDE